MAMFGFPSFPAILAMLLALSVHECAHALVANWLGDPTAKYDGRLTLNPLAHLDLLGTLLFLTVGFGWGKPVPVNPRNLHHPKRDSALVSLAGPASNLILALLCFALLRIGIGGSAAQTNPLAGGLASLFSTSSLSSLLGDFLITSLIINLALMAFNLLPIAPLDGSKIVAAFVPPRLEDRYESFMRIGPFVLLFLIIAGRALPVDLISAWISFILSPIERLLAALS